MKKQVSKPKFGSLGFNSVYQQENYSQRIYSQEP